jgi:16S rRNA (guanine(966)-N(2))-methyltransferase RsmD
MMRIVTGTAKGVRLTTLAGDQTRPTSERVKEAIFSSLQFVLADRQVLDLFAGSGQLGLEAMSRGARSAMFVDSSPEAIAVVKENARKTGFFESCRYLISDYRSYIRKGGKRDRWDLIFIDPPYALGCVGDALARILDAGIAAPGCLLVCESGEEDIFAGHEELADRFEIVKAARYSITYITILRLKEQPT